MNGSNLSHRQTIPEPYVSNVPPKSARATGVSSKLNVQAFYGSRNNSSEFLSSKQNIVKQKFTANESKIYHSKNKELHDPILESSEYKLLCKLFIPSKYLIHNGKITIRQLSSYLPSLVENAKSDDNSEPANLNFELHLFLSSIITKFVSTWYFDKINTDNYDFIKTLYKALCVFTGDSIKRIRGLLTKDLLAFLNDIAEILDCHIKELVAPPDSLHNLKFINDKMTSSKYRNTLYDVKNSQELLEEYLKERHVIFSESCLQEGNTSDEKETNVRKAYFRTLVVKIIETAFKSNSTDIDVLSSGLTTSNIAMNFTSTLLTDLVVDRLFLDVTRPSFIMEKMMNIAGIMRESLRKDPENNVKHSNEISISSFSLKKLLSSCYRNVNSVFVGIYHTSTASKSDHEDALIFDNHLFSLINTISNFSTRWPMCTSIMVYIKEFCLKSQYGTKIDAAIKRYFNDLLYSKFSNKSIASGISQLRTSLFSEEKDKEKEHALKQTHITSESVSEELCNLIFQDIATKHSLIFKLTGISTRDNDDQENLKKSITQLLTIFDSSNFEEDSNPLNQLLVINLIDSLLSFLYPELLVDGTSCI
ncbi:Piso0_003183 [Millerozyma farinosa CBS 7064]|uniref:Piso0_003183 protein n=1 Tax=Pichia sorbitophila (strain ATCC MYA-4447 / BCRC 22081 / CBS 7064 / NBRC 10061 / NRRL Y-12695) TaxID=559304 RepID=G8YHE8_PICSO|nr:Piso0_003183 [Millerozyma farinosa CBS 7064]CCE80850.1 Piso0_003183 [Millerozyma farinosa CBS 7064]